MDAQVIVIGAGVSGLVAANVLVGAGISTIVVDKGRSVGGRLATRRVQNGLADHGAQFFTVRSAELQQHVDQWLALDIAHVWGMGWSDGSLQKPSSDGHPRYVMNQGMNALAVGMAQQVDARVNTEVTRIEWHDAHWTLHYGDGQTLTAAFLLMTPPVPQTLRLLGHAQVPLHNDDRAALEKIQYDPCLCGLYVVEGDVMLPEPGALQAHDKTVYWMADNKRKGISAQTVLTLHANAAFSRAHYDDAEPHTLAVFDEALAPYLAADATITERQLKKWRYSIPTVTHPDETLQAKELPLFFAGDAFGGRGRVEGAFLSGTAAGKAIAQRVNA